MLSNCPLETFQNKYTAIVNLINSDEYNQELETINKKLNLSKIVLYGAGTVGISIATMFEKANIKIQCFCDKIKIGKEENTGLPIIKPSDLNKDYKDAIIIISTFYYANEIKKDLILNGVCENRIFELFLNKKRGVEGKDITQHLAGYERAFNIVADQKSKDVIMGRLQCILTPFPIIPLHLIKIKISNVSAQYFDDEMIHLDHDEVFVDGGMFTGDTAMSFFKHTNNKYKYYYGFEPDENNCTKAEENLINKTNISIIPKGLWHDEGEINFNSGLGGSSGFGNEINNPVVKVMSLDAFFSDKIPPTFIKMDIEGAELEALKGCENIIRKFKPKLAICAYHKPEDIYTLPEIIKQYRNDYTFYFRHYTNSLAETVLYAI